ncbi:MAG: hypothetical protein ABI411_08195 [Tahibacter sp.]
MRTPSRAIALFFGISAFGHVAAATWIRTRELSALPPLTASSVQLGSSVAVDVNVVTRAATVLYIGAPYQAVNGVSGAGVVYVYAPGSGPGGWTLVDTVTAPVPQADAHFGATVAVSGLKTLIVGSPDWNNGATVDAGRVDFFKDVGFSSPDIVANGSASGNGGHFGRAVAINGDYAAASSPGAGGGAGCVFTFHRNQTTFFWEFDNSICGAGSDALGASVAILQTASDFYLLFAGAPGHAQGGFAAAGAAYAYAPVNNALQVVGNFSAPNPALIDSFGTAIAADANFVYVGATGRDLSAVGRTGSVSVFKPAFIIGYDFVREIFPATPRHAGDLCGATLAVDVVRSQFIMGCPGSDGLVSGEGAARVMSQIFPYTGTPSWSQSLLGFSDLPHGADELGRSVAVVGDRAFVGAPKRDISLDTDHGALELFSPELIFANGFDGVLE